MHPLPPSLPPSFPSKESEEKDCLTEKSKSPPAPAPARLEFCRIPQSGNLIWQSDFPSASGRRVQTVFPSARTGRWRKRRVRLLLAWQLRLFRIHAQALGTLAIRLKMRNILNIEPCSLLYRCFSSGTGRGDSVLLAYLLILFCPEIACKFARAHRVL